MRGQPQLLHQAGQLLHLLGAALGLGRQIGQDALEELRRARAALAIAGHDLRQEAKLLCAQQKLDSKRRQPFGKARVQDLQTGGLSRPRAEDHGLHRRFDARSHRLRALAGEIERCPVQLSRAADDASIHELPAGGGDDTLNLARRGGADGVAFHKRDVPARARHGRRHVARQRYRAEGRHQRDYEIGLANDLIQIAQTLDAGLFGPFRGGLAAAGHDGNYTRAGALQAPGHLRAHLARAQDGDGIHGGVF
jgi:hypothetical protein